MDTLFYQIVIMYEIQQDQMSDILERTDYYILCIKDDDDDEY